MPILAAIALALSISGCASLSEAEPYFLRTSPEVYAPKDKKAEVPLLLENPKQEFRVIGTLRWEATRNWRFMRRAIERLARKNGADAVVLREHRKFRETSLVDIPPSIRWIPVTRWITITSGTKNRRTTGTVPVVENFPVFVPGRVEEIVTNWNAVEADLIVFANTHPIGKIPSADLSVFSR